MADGFFHFQVTGFGRGETVSGAAYRSGGVVAKAAYRSGERLHNHEQSAVYDFTERAESVQGTMILAPPDAPAWAHDREKLWNQAEEMEIHRQGKRRIATEFEIGLPHELNADQRRELLGGFVQKEIVDKHHVAADIAFHKGRYDNSDERNFHAHVMITHREIGADGFGPIANQRDHWHKRDGEYVQEKTSGIASRPADIKEWRQTWERHANEAYREAGLDIQVDHRSHKDRGLDIEPQKHMGPKASAIERQQAKEGRELNSQVGNINRAIAARNEARQHGQEPEREQPGTSGFDPAAHRARKEAAELRRTAQLDRVDGRPATAEDISRQLSERYRAAEEQMWGLRREASELKKERTAWGNELHGAERDHADRLQQMGWLARKAHDFGIKDKDLARYEERQQAAEAKLQELKPISELKWEARGDQVRRPDTTARDLKVEDVARHLSPEYKAAVDRTWEARGERREWGKEFYPRLEAAYGAAKERGAQIKKQNRVRRDLHQPPIRNDGQMRAISREIKGLKREKAAVNNDVKAAERAEAKEFRKIAPQAKEQLQERQGKAQAARKTLRMRGRETPLKDRFAAAEKELNAAFQEVGAMATAILEHRQQQAQAAREEMQREADRERELRRERERGQDLDRGR